MQENGHMDLIAIADLFYKGDYSRLSKHQLRLLENNGYIAQEGNKYVWSHGMLRPYQVHTINRVMGMSAQKILVSLATGTGKTFTALEMVKASNSSLFVTPRINLTHQTKAVFAEDLDDIGILQGAQSSNLGASHIVSNLQTLQRRVEDGSFDISRFDLIIFDEVHYSHENIVMLMDKMKHQKIIGLTATPFDATGNPLKGFDVIVEDFSVNYFIANGYLSPLVCMQTMDVDDSKLRKSKNGDFTLNSINAITVDTVRTSNIMEMTIGYVRKSKKVMVFASSIAHCEMLGEAFREAGVSLVVLHSEIDDDPLGELNRFKTDESIQMIISVAMLSFGTDVPAVDCCIVARPMRSRTLWVQTVGRALRVSEDKQEALLLDCGGNLRRLGHPFQKIIPKEQVTKTEPTCYECGHQGQRYLIATEINKDLGKRLSTYRCSICANEHNVSSDVQTIQCEGCGIYYLQSEAVYYRNKLVIRCNCGTNTVLSDLVVHKFQVEDLPYEEKLLSANKRLGSLLFKHFTDSKITASIGAFLSGISWAEKNSVEPTVMDGLLNSVYTALDTEEKGAIQLSLGDAVQELAEQRLEMTKQKKNAAHQELQKKNDAEARMRAQQDEKKRERVDKITSLSATGRTRLSEGEIDGLHKLVLISKHDNMPYNVNEHHYFLSQTAKLVDSMETSSIDLDDMLAHIKKKLIEIKKNRESFSDIFEYVNRMEGMYFKEMERKYKVSRLNQGSRQQMTINLDKLMSGVGL